MSTLQANTLKAELTRTAPKYESLADTVAVQPSLLPELFAGLDADKARVKYGCLKLLRILSDRNPEVLYLEIDRLFRLLESENRIMQWGAAIIIGNLAAVDSEKKIDRILDRYLQPISGHVMITAANVIGGAGRIAQAKPYLADRIARALSQVETAHFQTPECRNVALGHAIRSLDLFFDKLGKPQPSVEFVRRQLNNPRPAVKRAAALFLKRHLRPALSNPRFPPNSTRPLQTKGAKSHAPKGVILDSSSPESL